MIENMERGNRTINAMVLFIFYGDTLGGKYPVGEEIQKDGKEGPGARSEYWGEAKVRHTSLLTPFPHECFRC